MKNNLRTGLCILALTLSSTALAAPDPLRATLEESKASGKGLTFYVKGQAIAGVVTSVDDQHVVARSQAQGTIVLRLDRIDGVAGHVALPGAKAP
jgi:hypothetical protein